MNNGYSVDDILNEIQAKRSSTNGTRPNLEFKREELDIRLGAQNNQQNNSFGAKNSFSKPAPSNNFNGQQSFKEPDKLFNAGTATQDTEKQYDKSELLQKNAQSFSKPSARADIFNNFGGDNDKANEISNSKMMFDNTYFNIKNNTENNEFVQKPSTDDSIIENSKAEAADDIYNNTAVQNTADSLSGEQESQNAGPKFKFKVNLPENISDDLPTQMNIPIQQKPAPDDAQSTRHIDLSYGFSSNTPQANSGFTNARQQKMQSFVMQDIAEDEAVEGFAEEQPAIDEDDYNSPQDKANVLKDIRSVKISLFIRLIFSGLATALLTYLALSVHYTIMPLPEAIWPENNMQLFFITNVAVLAVTTLVCNATIGSGIASLFKLKPNNDTSAALAVLLSLIQGAALIFKPEKFDDPSVHIYFSIAALALFFNAVGKMLLVSRIERNFDVISSEDAKLAFEVIKNGETAREFTRGQNIEEPVVAYTAKAGFLTSFLTESYSEDYNEGFFGKTVTAMSLMGSIMVSLTTMLIKSDVYFALTTFSALMCVCSALSTTLTSNLPLNKASAKLTEFNAEIAGYSSVEKYSAANALVIDSTQLFTEDSVILHGLKVFDQSKIDEAIVDAASVVSSCKNHLRGVFLKVLDGKESMLKNVDSIVYEDSLGISAWVDGKRVLIGNRDLMLHHGIETPTKEFEMKFIRDGREVLYLSNSGELTSMFVLSYNKTDEIEYELNKLRKHKISLLVNCNDPNLTAAKISEIYGYPADYIKILPSKLHAEHEQLTKPKERASSSVSFGSAPVNVFRTLNAVFTVRSASMLSTLIQFIGIIIGYAVISYFAFTGDLSAVTFHGLMLYQVVCALFAIIVPSFKRY